MPALLETDPIDWELDVNDDLIIPMRYTKGLPAIAQGTRIRVRMVRGEWFADIDRGVPYFERDGIPSDRALLGQKFNQLQAAADFRAILNETPGVTSVPTLTVEFDAPTRMLQVSWRTRTAWGDTPPDLITRTI